MPALDAATCRRRFAAARHAVLATSADDVPHLVPVTFAVVPALDGAPDRVDVVTAVDHKPKRTSDLRRLRNLRANPRAALLVDVYDDDWDRLWWVRVDVRARSGDAGREAALDALAARYAPYRRARPSGPVVRLAVERWRGWSAR
ncbi:TIGR03668 family PPOX class F420-dependent oxidoreductase [Isoptericola sp. 178]|uniref:TIGR03668 family PPOX class F420-dependent oxidoreductase n=1 Tax=Isoptericola sp. 178 TaxID=3064651 RepID=UPI0027127A51|nr:TIGR03668 family PPOX class F420-dependent oxidoreductase [Isoptericola sp. 178]MDO8145035.1 TIGR03668 family PPOX class F420-dependent oxidoreductase [Isoptericola sp. 178]